MLGLAVTRFQVNSLTHLCLRPDAGILTCAVGAGFLMCAVSGWDNSDILFGLTKGHSGL